MKKLILLFASVSLLACSAENNEDVLTGDLSIPEIFHGSFQGVNTGTIVKIYPTALKIGEKEIKTALTQNFDTINKHYYITLEDNKSVRLVKSSYRGVTTYEGSKIILNEPLVEY